MLQIREDLCLGCGLCTANCPQQAIWLLEGRAKIDQSKCNLCRRCIEICPRGAIVERIPASKEELRNLVSDLRQQTNHLLQRLEKLKH